MGERTCRATSFRETNSSGSRGVRSARARSTPVIRTQSPTGVGAISGVTASTRRWRAVRWTISFQVHDSIRVTRGETGPGVVDSGYPKPISDRGWGDFGAHGIDAALYSDTKCYFFAGEHYIRVSRGDVDPGQIDSGYPAPISDWAWGDFGAH